MRSALLAGPSRCLPRRFQRAGAPVAPCPLLRARTVARGGVYVPSDSFGGQSPEKKAAGILRTFFTFVAARVVLAQLEGSGRGALGAYDSSAAHDLHHFLQNVPMRDGDDWLQQLMRKNTSLGLRLMEVRDSYTAEAFEWDQLERLAKQDMKNANAQLMRKFATASLQASLAAAVVEAGADGGTATAESASASAGATPGGPAAPAGDAGPEGSSSGSSGPVAGPGPGAPPPQSA